MQKKAHITSRRSYSIGDEVVGLCGRVFTVEVLWADIPKKHRICRDCVDKALAALSDADLMIESARVQFALVARRFTILNEEFLHDSVLDELVELDQAHLDEVTAAKRLASTCTCTWTVLSGGNVIRRENNPECPIHKDQDDRIAIEVPEDEGELDAIGVDVPEGEQ